MRFGQHQAGPGGLERRTDGGPCGDGRGTSIDRLSEVAADQRRPCLGERSARSEGTARGRRHQGTSCGIGASSRISCRGGPAPPAPHVEDAADGALAARLRTRDIGRRRVTALASRTGTSGTLPDGALPRRLPLVFGQPRSASRVFERRFEDAVRARRALYGVREFGLRVEPIRRTQHGAVARLPSGSSASVHQVGLANTVARSAATFCRSPDESSAGGGSREKCVPAV